MADRADRLRDELQRRLFGLRAAMPTTALGRLGRSALAALRGGKLASRGKDGELDIEGLTALVGSIGQLKGIAMKAGQLLSYLDLAVPPELQAALSVLQTHSPPMPFPEVAAIVQRELGDRAGPLLAHMIETPAAAASIGQVHRARLADGIEVAVKIQYPDIEKAIAADFLPARVGTSFVGLLVPGADIEAIVTQARLAVLEECDYEREAGCQERFAAIYRDHDTLAVPAVHHAFCSRRVLTTTWCAGQRFDDFLASDPPQETRDRIGRAIFEFYVGTLFRHGLYNWDPHPGNYVLLPDGRIAMLDYGSTREFDPGFVRKLATLGDAVHSDTREALHAALLDLGMVRPDRSYDFDGVRALVRAFHGPMLHDEVLTIEPGTAQPLREILANKRKLLELRLPGEMLFVLRIRFGVMSVLARLRARANWYRLERECVAAPGWRRIGPPSEAKG